MSIHQHIRNKHIAGGAVRSCVVRADDSDDRDWLAIAPICPQLRQHQIAHCGIMHASHPMEIVRLELSGTFFLACFEGQGQVLIDGNWQDVNCSRACVQPPFIPNALKTQRRKKWQFCWVRYQEMPEVQPIVSIHSPVLGAFDPKPLRAAIEGLHAEATPPSSPAALQHWTELIHGYVLSFAQPFRGDDRLRRVWEAVEARLDQKWTLDRMARIACLSKEHLRRLATQSLGRSPMQHVTFLRVRQAAELLATTEEKITTIARQVGYANAFAFSDTFQRWAGCRPSVYRERSQHPCSD